MKKLLLIITIVFTFNVAFAFEGVIEQTYTDVNTKSQQSFVWYISGDDVRLEIKNGEELIVVIPDFKENTISLFGDKADKDGKLWYSKVSISQIDVDVPKMRLLEETKSIYNGKDAKDIKLMSADGLFAVQYLNDIDVNMKNMMTAFAESKEFGAIFLTGDQGFPVTSMIMTENEAINTLTTKSIDEKSISSAMFVVPSNYALFTTESIK
ncbi:MAG: hypothetical protein ACI8ZX_001195 [Planctomycetota bacterium]|jgi:hypothetical protein